MSHFSYHDNTLCVDGVSLKKMAAEYGTPLYVYSKEALTEAFLAYSDSCKKYEYVDTPTLICYSVKSNSNLAILNLLGKLGSGFDIVSGGELLRVIAAGCDPHKVIFSGVGKTIDEIRLALEQDILCFNVESEPELHRINDVAREMGKKARISFRINPNIDAKTHPYISTGLKENKFGIAFEDALSCYLLATSMQHIEITGIDCHIGSQLLDDAPLLDAFDKLVELFDQLTERGIELHHIDIGGGVGIVYDQEKPVAIPDYIKNLFARVNQWRDKKFAGKPIQILLEPGRSVSGNAGVLLTEIQYLKHGAEKNFAIVDAAMNDLMRPALYDAWHKILPVLSHDMPARKYDIVGPICESSDWLGRDRQLKIQQGDLIAIMSAGAYGMVMSSNYNTRGRAAEVLVEEGNVHLVRKRETAPDLFATETILP